MFPKIIAFSYLISISSFAFSQRLITGKIKDANSRNPVENASVTVFKGTEFATTNSHGYFQLTVGEEDSLLITHRDYKTGLMSIPEADIFTILIVPHNTYPIYSDGSGALYKYLQLNLKYPTKALVRKIEGVVLLQLILNPNGEITDCRILREIGGKCGETASSVFKNIPGKWTQSQETKSLIFPLVYIQRAKPKTFYMPDIKLPVGKIMEAIQIYSHDDF
jgi:hypothetical protein